MMVRCSDFHPREKGWIAHNIFYLSWITNVVGEMVCGSYIACKWQTDTRKEEHWGVDWDFVWKRKPLTNIVLLWCLDEYMGGRSIEAVHREAQPECEETWNEVSACPVTCCVTLGRWLPLRVSASTCEMRKRDLCTANTCPMCLLTISCTMHGRYLSPATGVIPTEPWHSLRILFNTKLVRVSPQGETFLPSLSTLDYF